MAEEWRLQVELDDEEHGLSLGERLRAMSLDDEARERLGDRAIVTRDGSKLFVYTDSEVAAREAERVVRELIAQARAEDTGELPYDVSVELPGVQAAEELEQRLRDEGLQVHRRWRHVVAGAPSEERAEELAARLRGELGDAEVAVEAHGVRYPTFTLLGWSS